MLNDCFVANLPSSQTWNNFRHWSQFVEGGTVENGISGKNMANFCENCQNHGSDMASNDGPNTIYKTQHLALTTIITCS